MKIYKRSYFDRIVGNIKAINLSSVGRNTLPETIYVYSNNFKDKTLVTDYLDVRNGYFKVRIYEFDEDFSIQYNSDGSGKTYSLKVGEGSRESEIKYTDSFGVIIKLIDAMINIAAYALVAITALSLVISSVMIVIITYVSVMERIKEIGVIRTLGSNKKDFFQLFNAETFFIGLAAGIIGIVVFVQVIKNKKKKQKIK